METAAAMKLETAHALGADGGAAEMEKGQKRPLDAEEMSPAMAVGAAIVRVLPLHRGYLACGR